MIIDDDKDEYEVEEITKCVKILGQVFYKIKWMNYDKPTWEPASNLNNCKDKLSDYC